MGIDQINHGCASSVGSISILAADFTLPSNIGSVFRIADALGVAEIFLAGSSPRPPNRKIKQAARSTDKYVTYSYWKDPLLLIEKLKKDNFKIVSLEVAKSSKNIRQHGLSKKEKVCLVLGSEKNGVCEKLLLKSDLVLHIPMLGANSSMNVASACAIAVYELTS